MSRRAVLPKSLTRAYSKDRVCTEVSTARIRRIFIAAIGPDFKTHYVDDLPASNADIGKTLASLLKLDIPANGKLIGRVLTETMPDSPIPTVTHQTIRSRGLHVPTTILNVQDVGATRYFDAAGFAGRTVGLNATSR